MAFKVTINKSLEDNSYPLPTADDLFSMLAGREVFSKSDLTQACQQLELTEASKPLCTINTHQGLDQIQRLPFGVKTAPSIFQSVMDRVLVNIPGVGCILDDILTGTKPEEHLRRLEDVLKRLAKHHIVAKLPKCRFRVPEVVYFGHRVNAEGRACVPEKVDAILKAKTPTNVAELRTFLGFVGYYGVYLPNLSTTFSPLYRLLRDDVPWEWTGDCNKALEQVKKELTSDRVLVHYDTKKELILATDASPHGVGAVISHRMRDESERPIAFGSRSLSDNEKNNAQIEKEALGIVYGVTKFHKYLYGRKFELYTDHEPLTKIFGPHTGVPTLAALLLQRWALILMAYDYTIHYRRSAQNANADILSRFPVDSARVAVERPVNYFSLADELPVAARDIAEETRKDPVMSRVFMYIQNGWPRELPDSSLQPYWNRHEELSVDQGCILWGFRVVIPPKYRQRLLSELHHEHWGVVMKSMARGYLWFPGIDQDIETLVSACDACLAMKDKSAPAPLIPWPYPTRVWQRVHIDFGYLNV
ncbi:uncharacterized protein K02A2.6-like [Lineus longissimus]|uniref:uncharacterized protein K02A2.6-like n=1 Tax=Lineus longissimus TaxID=88925 RepID=UPI00315D2B27